MLEKDEINNTDSNKNCIFFRSLINLINRTLENRI